MKLPPALSAAVTLIDTVISILQVAFFITLAIGAVLWLAERLR